jgi:hypothetical protein
MDAAALQTFKVYIPGILKSHARNTERIALDSIQQLCERILSISGAGFAAAFPGFGGAFAVSPVAADIIFRSLGSIISWRLRNSLILCGRNQSAIFSQHGERRKGTVGILSPGGDEIFNLQLSMRLALDGEEYVGYQDSTVVAWKFGVSAKKGHRLEVHAFDDGHPFLGKLD